MTAITKVWTAPVPARQDPGRPITSQWGNDVWDNLQNLHEWIGADYAAGAVQNHDHDGVNSALIEVGPNLARNGSFEEGEVSWSFIDYTGGSHAINVTNRQHGAQSMAITSTVLANGGGEAITGFIPCSGDYPLPLRVWYWASVVDVSSRIDVIWYDNAKAQISASSPVDTADTPTVATAYSYGVMAPANARFCRVRLIGGVPGAGTSVGSVFFDGVMVSDIVKISNNMLTAAPVGTQYTVHSNDVEKISTAVSWTKMKEIYVGIKGTYNIYYESHLDNGSGNAQLRVNDVAVGILRGLVLGYVGFAEDIALNQDDLVQVYTLQTGGANTYVQNFRVRSSGAFGFVNTLV